MSLPNRFAEAAGKVSSGSLGNVSQNDQLDLYGLFAVVKKGPAPNQGPSAFLDPRGFAKWTAWANESHLNKEEAMLKYIELVAKHETEPKVKGDGETSNTDGFGNKGSSGFDVGEGKEGKFSKHEWDICYWATIGDVKSVKHCLEQQNVSPNFRDQDGLTPLMRAVDRNEAHVVDVLIAAGADLEAVDEEGQTALHYAAYCEHIEMAGLLVSYGGSFDTKDNDDMTPFEAATEDTAKTMREAKSGTWKRATEPYQTGLPAKMRPDANYVDRKWQILLGVSFVTAAVLIVHYRYRR